MDKARRETRIKSATETLYKPIYKCDARTGFYYVEYENMYWFNSNPVQPKNTLTKKQKAASSKLFWGPDSRTWIECGPVGPGGEIKPAKTHVGTVEVKFNNGEIVKGELILDKISENKVALRVWFRGYEEENTWIASIDTNKKPRHEIEKIAEKYLQK